MQFTNLTIGDIALTIWNYIWWITIVKVLFFIVFFIIGMNILYIVHRLYIRLKLFLNDVHNYKTRWSVKFKEINVDIPELMKETKIDYQIKTINWQTIYKNTPKWITNEEYWKIQKIRNSKRLPSNEFKSTEREDNKELFKELQDLFEELSGITTVVELAKRIWVTSVSLWAIKTNSIGTVKTALKYLKKLKKVKKELLIDIENWRKIHTYTYKKKNKDINVVYHIANEKELQELNILIDTALEYMTQNELWLRMNIPQSAVSYMANRKTIRLSTVKEYVEKLKPIVAKLDRTDFIK